MGSIEIETGVILIRTGCGVVGDREVRPFSVVVCTEGINWYCNVCA